MRKVQNVVNIPFLDIIEKKVGKRGSFSYDYLIAKYTKC
jgi:hypothetical protein